MAFQPGKIIKIKKKRASNKVYYDRNLATNKINNYINIFNKEFVNKLLFNHLKDYIIKINNKNLLYGPLYNLSAKKLEVLRQYLNKTLEKGWIRPFINLIRVSILFILKKDGNL